MALKQGRSIPLLEDIDPDYEPSSEEIADYAQWLGLDLEAEKDLVWICREGLKAKLPADWKAFRTADDGEVYYYNAASGDSSWEHPCDERFMKLYADEKAKLVARRKTHEQASSTGAQPVKPKPGVLPPLQLAPLGGKAALPPLSKAPLQQAQPVLSSTPLQPSNSISSAPATPMSAQGVLKPLKQPLDAPASAKSRSSLPKGPLGEPVMESIRSEKQSRAVPSNQDVKADTQKAKLDSEGRLAAMRRELLAAEDRERAELEREYRQASEPYPAVRSITLECTNSHVSAKASDVRMRARHASKLGCMDGDSTQPQPSSRQQSAGQHFLLGSSISFGVLKRPGPLNQSSL